MLELEQQGIKRALVDSQKVSADLLDAPGDSPAVLRSQDIECLEDHQRQCSLQDVWFFLHGESTFRFPTGIMTCFLLESNRRFELSFDDKPRRAVGESAGTLFLEDGVAGFPMKRRQVSRGLRAHQTSTVGFRAMRSLGLVQRTGSVHINAFSAPCASRRILRNHS